MTVGSHQKPIGKNDERFTPVKLWRPFGPFTTDAAAGAVRPWSIGADRNITIEQNCLVMDWRPFGLTWLNPPFNRYGVGAFVLKMCEHNRGVMLLHHRSDTQWWQPIGDTALLQLEVAGRIIFHNADGSPATITDPKSKYFGKVANSGAAVTLFAFGNEAAERLGAVAARPQYDGRELVWPEGRIPGGLRSVCFPRGVLALAIADDPTWRQLVSRALREQDGPVPVAKVFDFVSAHAKAQGKKHVREKVRQALQRGAGKRVGPDQWVAA